MYTLGEYVIPVLLVSLVGGALFLAAAAVVMTREGARWVAASCRRLGNRPTVTQRIKAERSGRLHAAA
jgi:hypothetical protein